MALDILYFTTLSSDGEQTTSSPNEVIVFDRKISSLNLKAVSDLSVKLNDNTAAHYLKAGETLVVEKMIMRDITIVENGATYQYDALT